MPLWFDSHCHFDFAEFDQNRQSEWQFARRVGVSGLLIPGVTHARNLQLEALCQQYSWSFALGLHPYFLAEHEQMHFEWLDVALESSSACAVGECGLDRVLAVDDAHWQQQLACFSTHIQLAKRHKLPLILHVRGCHDETVAMLRRARFEHGGVVHAFSGSEQQGKAWLDLGFCLGVGGAMSHPRAQKLRRTIAALPSTAWLLETDAPDMKPAFWQGAMNSPAAIPVLAAMLAQLQGTELGELSEQLERNRQRVLPGSYLSREWPSIN